MYTGIEERACEIAAFMIERKATVRAAAARFGISKSTVHKDVTVRLRTASPELFRQVQAVLAENWEQRHLRGGLATREKYAAMARATAQLRQSSLNSDKKPENH